MGRDPQSGRDPGDDLRRALARPGLYPHKPKTVEVRETHISWVFLAGERAYKLKKPLVLDFLDYGTPAKRRRLCAREVELNRRLAPDVYIGVRGVALREEGFRLTGEDDPEALDYLVEMHRYNESDTLASRLGRGELRCEQVAETGRFLAAFHARAARAKIPPSPVLGIQRQFHRNLQELLGCIDERGEVARCLALERFAHAFTVAHGAALADRARGGCLREGHGDLRAEHVVVDGAIQIVDCVEFDRRLRYLDVSDDLAFLVFDLFALGGARFRDPLIRAYREAGGDPGEDAVIAFYAAYRALVRAKIACLRASQHPAESSVRGHASAQARDLIGVAEHFAWRARLPLAVIVCGLPASGKSTLASALARSSALAHLSSDVTRKRLAGLKQTEAASGELYASEWNARTYAELGRRAKAAVAQAGGAIIDATFRHAADRESFAGSFDRAAPVLFIECQAPGEVLVKRAARRDREPARVSDASAQVVAAERDSWQPLDEVSASEHLALRTDRDLDGVVGDVLALLDRRMRSPGCRQ